MERHSAARLGACLLALFCAISIPTQAGKSKGWTISEVGVLASQGSFVNDLNSRGDVVGWSPVNTVPHAFLWQNGATRDLGMTVGSPPGNSTSIAYAVSDRGTVVGSVNGEVHLWSDGVPLGLGFTGQPSAINKHGVIAGGRFSGPILQGGEYRGFIYQGGVLHHLPTLGGSESHINALNDKGIAAGYSLTALDRDYHAFVYEDGAMKDLGTLGGGDSFANGINNHGVVVGTSQTGDGSFAAFVYEPGRGMRQLLPTFSNATGINERGAIVGNLRNQGVLVEDGVVTTLIELAEVRAAGWSQLFPQRINDRGWIAGYGLKAGGIFYTGFVLVPR